MDQMLMDPDEQGPPQVELDDKWFRGLTFPYST